ncbi:MAG: Ig-like domain-containing protein [Pirellulales bacterium]|nr:Ig-like domain-containing protein [Pirellulales bacterium]
MSWRNIKQLHSFFGTTRKSARGQRDKSSRGQQNQLRRSRLALCELLEPRIALCAEHAGNVELESLSVNGNVANSTIANYAPREIPNTWLKDATVEGSSTVISSCELTTCLAGPQNHAGHDHDEPPEGQSAGFGGFQWLGVPITYAVTAAGLPILNSFASAPADIYLDFDGDTGSATTAYDTDGNPATFSVNEQKEIAEAWRHISNYFAMFNVNVTTVYTAARPKAWHISGNNISGGYSYVNVFPNSEVESFNQSGDARTRQSGIAHEVGHNFGLSHQSTYDANAQKVAEYRGAQDDYHGAIMGVDYAGLVKKWWLGHPSGSPSTLQDDLAVIAADLDNYGGDGYRADDYGGTIATASALTSSGGYQIKSGIIERLADVDAFSFTSTGGNYTINVGMDYPSGLDAKLEIRNAANALLAIGNSPVFNNQTVTVTLPAGTYYAFVSSAGNYGDVGTYNIAVANALSTQSANWANQDIGGVGHAGYSHYNPTTSTFTVAGSGSDIWGTADEFQYAFQKLTGDGSIEARVTSLDPTNGWAKTGVMIRETTAANSRNVFMQLSSANGAQMSWRDTAGANSGSSATNGGAFTQRYVRLVRSGNTFTGFVKTNAADPWTLVSTHTTSMASTVLIGLATTAHEDRLTNHATFTDVAMTGNISDANTLPTLNALAAPTGLTVTGITSTSVSLSWTNGAGETGYTIERSTDGVSFVTAGTVAANTTTFTDTGRTSALMHFYRIRANENSTVSAPSAVVSATTRAGAVTNFTVSTWTTTSLILDWREVAGETGYRVERSTNGTTWSTIANLAAQIPSYTNTGLSGTLTYYYRIVTLDSLGDAATSTVVSTQTPLPAVATFTSSAKTTTSVTLNWSDLTGETGYRLERSTDGVNFTTIASPAANVLTYNDTGLNLFTKYVYRVRGMSGAILGSPKDLAVVTNGNSLPLPWTSTDIGTAPFPGQVHYLNGVYSDYIGSNDVWGTTDNFRFTRLTVSGDVSIIARVDNVENVAAWAKAGVMIRSTTGINSQYAFALISGDSGAAFQYRTTTGGNANGTTVAGITDPQWVRLTRVGNVFTAFYSPDGTTWTQMGTSQTIAMGTTVQVGLAHTSNNGSATNPGRADFSNVRIVNPNVPAGANPESFTINEDTSLLGNVLTNDIDVNGNTLTATLNAQPTKGDVTLNANGSFTYIPDANATGTDTFTYFAFDGTANSAPGVVTINITPINDAPQANNRTLTVAEDGEFNGILTGSDPDSIDLTYSVVGQGTKGFFTVVNPASGSFRYTPFANATGSDSFTFKITDDLNAVSNTATVSVTITPVNDPPVANNQSIAPTEDTVFNGMLTGSDIDSATLTYAVVDQGTLGTVVVVDPATGAFTYTPLPDAAGPDSFTFQITDDEGGLSTVATVTVNISPINDSPVANDGVLTTDYETPFNGALTGNDVDSSSLTYAIVAQGTKGTVNITDPATGAYTYTPLPGESGGDSFTFQITDSANATSNIATITVTINPNTTLAPNLDFDNGLITFTGRAGVANTLSLALINAGAEYQLTDNAQVIILTNAAMAAGWTGGGTNTVTGPAGTVASLTIATGDNPDTVTLGPLGHGLTVTGGGDAGDTLVFNGLLSVVGGNLQASGFDTISQNLGATLDVGPTGTINLSAASGIILRDNLTAAATTLNPGDGTSAVSIDGVVALAGPLTLAGSKNVLVNAEKTLTVAGLRANNLTLDPGTEATPTRLVVQPDGGATGLVVVAGVLTLGNNSTLDLNDNDLVLFYDPLGTNPLATITAAVDQFFAGGTGVPVIGSTTVQDSGGTRVLVPVDNAIANFGDIAAPFYDLILGDSGAGTGFNQIIVRFTYPGDMNLDGQVNGGDYVVIDANLGLATPGGVGGWILGDSDFDGMVTTSDYVAIDSNLNAGVGNPLSLGEILASLGDDVSDFNGELLLSDNSLATDQAAGLLWHTPQATNSRQRLSKSAREQFFASNMILE